MVFVYKSRVLKIYINFFVYRAIMLKHQRRFQGGGAAPLAAKMTKLYFCFQL